MKNIIVCGLDGTLADTTHRQHYIERDKCQNCYGKGHKAYGFAPPYQFGECFKCKGTGLSKPQDWDSFYKACVNDAPINTTIHLVNGFLDQMNEAGHEFELWIVTGRSDLVVEETETWLAEHVGVFDRLIMRDKDDRRPDDELKRSWLLGGAIPKDRVYCVFEDRSRVVKMWRNEGLTCYQVAEGDF